MGRDLYNSRDACRASFATITGEKVAGAGHDRLWDLCRPDLLSVRYISVSSGVEANNYSLKLKVFHKFDSAAAALEEVSAIVEGKVTPKLASLLDSIKDEKKVSLAVADPKLGSQQYQWCTTEIIDSLLASAINKLPQLSIAPISDPSTHDLYRAIRTNLSSLIPGLLPTDISTMSLGLSHSLSRHKLKFSPDKVDTMVVQAIALLDDLDKELNMYAMRVKEWYGWHFPEMGKIVNDNLAYARVILKMGMRTYAAASDLAEILPEEIEIAVKGAAEVSMGTEITSDDLDNIQALAEQVINFTEYRQQLSSYLSSRMAAIAPNLTTLVGDLVGARLIAHAGSLMNLAKSPASTIQILGAEKALFRALKTKHDTPKYGLIYHASLIGQATGKNKGKIARVLAAKAAIGLRVDSLAEWGVDADGQEIMEEQKAQLGIDSRLKIERRLAGLEGKPLRSKGVAIGPNGSSSQPRKWEVKEARKYNPDADGLIGNEPAAVAPKLTPKVEEIKDMAMADAGASEDDVDAEAEITKEVHSDEHSPEVEKDSGDDHSIAASSPSKYVHIGSNGVAASGVPTRIDDDASETISTVSADTPDSPDSLTQQETNWQSSITGNTKEAKKARKKERHARKLALSEERSQKRVLKNEKLARRLARKEKRLKHAEQVARRDEREERQYAPLAEKAGLSVVRYKRKLQRGEIRFEADGTPVAISKKEIKKVKKSAESENSELKGKKKRKRGEDSTEGREKRKRK